MRLQAGGRTVGEPEQRKRAALWTAQVNPEGRTAPDRVRLAG